MPKKASIIPFEPGKYYHIYNRGNNRETIFFNSGNYHFFLNLYNYYLGPHLDTYGFVLIPNHFHFLVRMKETSNQLDFILNTRKFFGRYALNINKQEGRTGALFHRPVKRLDINDMRYLKYLLFYIHYNPIKHGLTEDFREYPYSSFTHFSNRKPSSGISVDDALFWFNDSPEEFEEFHDHYHNEARIKSLIIEDD